MFNKAENKIIKLAIVLIIIIFPFSFIGKHYRKWIIAFLLNSYSNTFIAPVLAAKDILKYPVRLLPSIYQSSIIYDYFLCSLFTVWYCRASLKDHWKVALVKVIFFALPQVLLEVGLEKNTKLIKYSKGWTGYHSFVTIALAKYTIRMILLIMDRVDKRLGNEA
ncbi:hypothetical protein LGQ02_09710 [Bacillus shivajii]|uniref:CBO0543 family protein n=1 Tax=Bacillus shivajii TaxID=1983719 RepID=UPI001CFC0E35|nr:CBO0543 family protein [Bacillus shivajii]UCZ54970.1 hypothetical protein LGQ02_09710 [Bacillus shivajii]